MLNQIRLRQLLGPVGVHTLEVHPTIDSTNTRAMALGRSGAAHLSLVVAESQTAGRGRLSRTWFSPPDRNLYFSLIARPNVPPQTLPQVTLAAGVGVARALGTLADGKVRLKWPNDIYTAERRKMGGILTELDTATNQPFAVIGIGLNVLITEAELPPEIRALSSSLKMITGHDFEREEVLAGVVQQLATTLALFEQGGLAVLRDDWKNFDILTGCRVLVRLGDRDFQGTARGIDENGSLQVETTTGWESVVAGDIVILP